jgi:colanic acid/amylovoran biosynthesis glycosyltransferase
MPRALGSGSQKTKQPIAVFCPEAFLPYSQTFIFDELRSHTRYDADVFAVARRNGDRFQYPRVHTPGNLLETLGYIATSRARAFDAVFEARRHCLVHAHFGTAAVFAQPYAQRYHLPLVVTFHGYDVAILLGYARALPQRWRYWKMSRAIFGDAAALLCASEELCDLVSKLSGRPEAVRLHHLGVETQRYHRVNELRPIPRVTMIGRFVEKKGHLYGIEAFARATGPDCPAQLSIVGSGPLERRYRNTVSRLGIEWSVTMHGVLGQREVADLLARTDVLLAPSCRAANGDRESGLLVVREAGAAGVTVIGTHHGGIPESIEDGRTGFLVPERDVEQMSRRLRELLLAPALRERMGNTARDKMRAEFELADRVAELEKVYDEVLGPAPIEQRLAGESFLSKRAGGR